MEYVSQIKNGHGLYLRLEMRYYQLLFRFDNGEGNGRVSCDLDATSYGYSNHHLCVVEQEQDESLHSNHSTDSYILSLLCADHYSFRASAESGSKI